MIKYTITKQGYVINKSEFSENIINCIKTDLTVRPYTAFNAKKNIFKVYLEDDDTLCMPKFYAIERFTLPYVIYNNEGKDINCISNIELRDTQKNIIPNILEAYEKNGGGILSLPCGFGKTIIALYFISFLKKKTLIIVHREFLIHHWIDKIKQYLKNVKISIIRSKNITMQECDIGICMLQTLSKTEFPKNFFDSYSHIIIDECHLVSTTIFSTIFFKINSKFMLGLSATPERKDNMSKVLKWHIGNIIPLNFINHKINIDVNRYVLNCDKENLLKNNEDKFSNKLTKILQSDIRNNIIVNILIEEIKKENNRQILLLSDRIEHLENLKKLLKSNNFNSSGLFIGGMSKEQLDISAKSKIILATYSMANEGLDIPTLNCLVLASPKIEIFQSIGRISRLQERNNYIKPLLIDFIDILSVFINESEKRLHIYRNNKYDVSDYVYDEYKQKFELNLSKNKNYNIYLIDEKIQENKHVNNNSLVDDLFNSFGKY
jgi:superfamily II DNA or RNA helicase